jgi:hypothetical protein
MSSRLTLVKARAHGERRRRRIGPAARQSAMHTDTMTAPGFADCRSSRLTLVKSSRTWASDEAGESGRQAVRMQSKADSPSSGAASTLAA